MQHIFVLDAERKPLMPCHPARARELMSKSKAARFRQYPFTIILSQRSGGAVEALRLKIDPGAKTTGLALVEESTGRVVWAAELEHRSFAIKKKMEDRSGHRRSRRTRKLRHRPARFENRTRPEGWLGPSLRSRCEGTITWVRRLQELAPITHLSFEQVRFDMQKMENPEISGVEYQQGTLAGYELREYLLEKWGRKCAYCGREDVPLQIEHIVPKSRGGSNRVSNLTLSCPAHNMEKGNRTAAEFGHPEVEANAKKPLRAAGMLNATRWAIWRGLKEVGLPLESGSGGRTKYNRTRQRYPKAHWIDAACVGESGEKIIIDSDHRPLIISAKGHGSRQMCATDAYGFPKQHKSRRKLHYGFQTGDIVRAVLPKGKYAGTHVGRIVVRATGSFDLKEMGSGQKMTANWKYCEAVHRADGYEYGAGQSLEELVEAAEACRAARDGPDSGPAPPYGNGASIRQQW